MLSRPDPKAGRFGARLFGAALALMALPGLSQAETLADALTAAYRNSSLLDQNRAVLRAADEGVAGAVASLRPVVSFIANSTYSEPAQPFSDNLTASLSLSAEMMLYDFGRSELGIQIAKETVLATREALVGVEQRVLLGAVIAFMSVRSAAEGLSISQNSVRVIEEELRAAQDRFEVGEVTRTDVAFAEARLAAVRAAEAAAAGRLAVAREAYKAATGAYPGRLSRAPMGPALPGSLAEAQAIAARSHPLVRQAQREVTLAELRVAAAAAERQPRLSGSARLSVDQDGNDRSSVGVTFAQTLYAGGALSSAHRGAIAGRDAARSGLLQSGVTIAQEVGNAWAEIAVSRAQISATDRQIRAATVAYQGVREEARLGARTTLDVLDAEQDLLDAQAARIGAETSQQIAVYALLAAMGLLTVEHLGLGIAEYDPEAYYKAVEGAPVTSVQGERLDRVLRAIGKD